MPDNDHLVADGCERARAAALPAICAEVERQYAEQLRAAGWLGRLRLRRRMRREIEKRLDCVAPPWALYIDK